MEIDILLKIFLAAVLGGIIGLERELAHKEAGFRTNMLIALGSCLFTILSIKFAAGHAQADPARIAAQIVTGIGFLGAGAIIQARFAIHGLTTAATIWTVAAIGVSVGFGYYFLAFIVTVLIFLILTLFRGISTNLFHKENTHAYIIKSEPRALLLMEIKKIVREQSIRCLLLNLHRSDKGFEIELVLKTSETKNRNFLETLAELEGIREIASEYI